ncbi:MAG TPA: metalloprotease [Thermoplasmata archaeon]|jgi:Zn-dependent protease|nr:metalloprotease [Thermoplasmata archaeon]
MMLDNGPFSSYWNRYTVGPPIRPLREGTTSSTEIAHLIIAFLVLSFDFVLLYGGLAIYDTGTELLLIAIAASAAITGFVAHEIAHKLSAQRRGYRAEFRLSVLGLAVSVVTAALGFLFAAPGATIIGGATDADDWGRISLAGPATNFGFSLGFLLGAFVASGLPGGGLLAFILLFLAFVNAWFAAFNMIPIGPLDGRKVYRWSAAIWAVSFAAFVALAGVLYYLVYYAPPLNL